jgi:salicylate hydroxylase
MQQYWYHLHDGKEQEKRDAMIGAEVSCEGDPFLWREPTFAPFLYGYDVFKGAGAVTAHSSVYTNGEAN